MFFVVWGSNPIQRSTRTWEISEPTNQQNNKNWYILRKYQPRNSSNVVLLSDCYDCCCFFVSRWVFPQPSEWKKLAKWWGWLCHLFDFPINWMGGGGDRTIDRQKIKWAFVRLHGWCSMGSFSRSLCDTRIFSNQDSPVYMVNTQWGSYYDIILMAVQSSEQGRSLVAILSSSSGHQWISQAATWELITVFHENLQSSLLPAKPPEN